jgi:ubiquinone/menaquinone biosynthesis C-methylase UbiE
LHTSGDGRTVNEQIFMSSYLPDWQLPPGVTRGLWDYLHDPEIARTYDQSLAGSSLFAADQRFAEQYFDRPGRLIDLGCGTGRLLLSFARRGYWVLGVDLSAEMLKQAGAKADAAGVTVERLQANLVELDGLKDETFDYAACLFSTLGMVAGAAQRERVLRHVYRLLRPGGRFVLHVHNRWFNFWDPQGRTWLFHDLLRSTMRRRTGGDRRMPVHQGIAGLTLHLFTRREAVRLLRKAGFRLLEVQPLSLKPDGVLPFPGWFGWLRAYGYLLAAERTT